MHPASVLFRRETAPPIWKCQNKTPDAFRPSYWIIAKVDQLEFAASQTVGTRQWSLSPSVRVQQGARLMHYITDCNSKIYSSWNFKVSRLLRKTVQSNLADCWAMLCRVTNRLFETRIVIPAMNTTCCFCVRLFFQSFHQLRLSIDDVRELLSAGARTIA